IVRSPDTENRMFQDAIYVLNRLVIAEDRRQVVSFVLAELLAAKPHSNSSWMSSNERKRLTILSSFHKSEAIDAVSSELLSQPVSDRIKLAALTRVQKDDYKAAVPSILKFIEVAEDKRIKFLGFRALAGLRPDHERVRTFIASDLLKAE